MTFERIPVRGTAPPDYRQRLAKIWETEPGILGWFSSVDHKEIGIRYIVTAFVFLALGGIEALIMRAQLARPNETLLTPEQYDQLFSMHGMTMIFLYAMPILSGFSNYLWPLLLGARDMAFPRVNALSYWLYVAAGIFMYTGFAMGAGPNDGWFNYVPYANKEFNPGLNMDFYALGMIFLGISTTVGSINFVVTFLRLRAPGMSINRVPIMIWGTLTASAANILVVPSVSLAFFMLWLDRNFGTHFFDVSAGGQPLLWQHLFWIFAHPWVYAIVLPAMGIVSDALPVFCRRPLVGYTAVVLSTLATMTLGFGVLGASYVRDGPPDAGTLVLQRRLDHHRYSECGRGFRLDLDDLAWPAGHHHRLSVLRQHDRPVRHRWRERLHDRVRSGRLATDRHVFRRSAYSLRADRHQSLSGDGRPLFLVPKFTGKMLGEKLGMASFWTMFIGFNVAFLPMHLTGLLGMPRRVYTYPAHMGWDTLNMITTIGAFVLAIGVLLTFVNVLVSLRQGRAAGANPWDAPTLEWSVPSPPPPYNFAVLPTVASRHPLWEQRLGEGHGASSLEEGLILDHARETIGTTALDSEPDVILKMPFDSPAPFVLTIGISAVFAGLLIPSRLWPLTAVGCLVTVAAILIWLWPERGLGQTVQPPSEEPAS